jgi:hypothetical protein
LLGQYVTGDPAPQGSFNAATAIAHFGLLWIWLWVSYGTLFVGELTGLVAALRHAAGLVVEG